MIMSPIESNLQHVRGVINDAITGLGSTKKQGVTLVAVSKTKPAGFIREAFSAGQRDFGENYVQEGAAKIAELADLRSQGITWHYLGPLQSNKARQVALNFDWMHGVDRVKIALAVGGYRGDMRPLNVCIQVNVSGEASKRGVPPADALTLARQVDGVAGLKLRGLMAIIENSPDEIVQRSQFRIMRQLFEELGRDGLDIDTLSMGMSQDYRIAIEEGATMVRVGSAIFGARA
jgi:PLP dependent protein